MILAVNQLNDAAFYERLIIINTQILNKAAKPYEY